MITYERLLEILHYDPELGVFTWLIRMSSRAMPGTIAGSHRKDGYLVIRIDNRKYLGHRLAWLYTTGSWPSEDLDHEDGNPSHNHWSNLRLATDSQNLRNAKLRIDSQTGVKGVTRDKRNNKFQARITTQEGFKSLGRFHTIEEAADVVKSAREQIHGAFANHG